MEKLIATGNGGYCMCVIRKDHKTTESVQAFMKDLEAHKFYAMRWNFTNRGIEHVVYSHYVQKVYMQNTPYLLRFESSFHVFTETSKQLIKLLL